MKFDRLRKNSDFLITYKKGASFGNRNLVIYYRNNGLEHHRIGFSVSKKVGNAVVRNRIKRRLRSYLQQEADIVNHYDIVLIAKESCKDKDYHELGASVQHLLYKTKLARTKRKEGRK